MRLNRPRFMVRRIYASAVLLVVSIVPGNNTFAGKSKKIDPFQIADDSKKPIEIRLRVVTKLSEMERQRFAEELSSQLPGDWDKQTSDAIVMLGRIGDDKPVKELEWIYPQDVAIPGKIRPAIRRSIEEMRKRHKLSKT